MKKSMNFSMKSNKTDCRYIANENLQYFMGKVDKIQHKIISGMSDANIAFSDLCKLLLHLGFNERVRGDHHIFTRKNLDEIINLQPKGAKAKVYQVKQVRELILKYRLGVDDDD
jgi:hypothetical protein